MWQNIGTAIAWVFIVGGIAVMGFAVYSGRVDLWRFGPGATEKIIKIENVTIVLKRAKTPEEHKASLNGVENIPDNAGMIFEFATDGYYGISTSQLLFPVDLIWVKADGVVVGVKPVNRSGLRDPVQAPAQARYVIMMKAGAADRYDIQTGMKLDI